MNSCKWLSIQIHPLSKGVNAVKLKLKTISFLEIKFYLSAYPYELCFFSLESYPGLSSMDVFLLHSRLPSAFLSGCPTT